MAAAKLRITYNDGRAVEVIASPKAQVETERRYELSLSDAKRIEHMYYLAYSSLFWSGQEPSDFESWLKNVVEVEDVNTDVSAAERLAGESADPTPADPPSDGSSG